MGNACRGSACSASPAEAKHIQDGATVDDTDPLWASTVSDPTKDVDVVDGVSLEALKVAAKDEGAPIMAPEFSGASTEFDTGESQCFSAGGSATDVADATATVEVPPPESRACPPIESAARGEAPAAEPAAVSEALPSSPSQDASGSKGQIEDRAKSEVAPAPAKGGSGKQATAKVSPTKSRKSQATKPKEAPTPPKKMSREERERMERQAKMRERMAAEKERKAEFERNKDKYMELAKDIMAGKYKKEGGGGGGGGQTGQPGANMRIVMPTPADRENTRTLVLGQFRAKYAKMNGRNANCPSASNMEPSAASSATSLYSASETQALTIQGGHVPLPRPAKVTLPKDFRKLLNKEFTISLEKLHEYDSKNDRMLVSVYGDIFDVSDRPDKYGPDAPYEWMTGHELTWGFVSGRDVPETVDQCYDLWKVAPESLRDNKIKLIYAWVAFYEYEYGKPVAKLDLYKNENGLKGPPMEESEDCCIM